MYICVKFLVRDLNPTLAPTLHKHIYLWSDNHIKGARWLNKFDIMRSENL